MSIVSSRVSSVASILKTPGSKSSLLDQPKRIRFKLPDNLKTVLLSYKTGVDCKTYKNLICSLRDSNLKDSELIILLKDLLQYKSKFDGNHGLLLEAILNIPWTDRSPEVITVYKKFVGDLMFENALHSNFVMKKIVQRFKPDNDSESEWENGVPRPEDLDKYSHIHDIIKKFLQLVPTGEILLMESLASAYPHTLMGSHSHESYVHALLQITQYLPHRRNDILYLIIEKLVDLDVTASLSNIQNREDEELDEDEKDNVIDDAIFSLDDSEEKKSPPQKRKLLKHPTARTLDICMEQMFTYIHDFCQGNEKIDIDLLKILYNDLQNIFDKLILTTSGHHVQFLLFYLCSLKPAVAETFVKFLLQKVTNPSLPPFIRQQAVSYIVSFLARATFISISLIKCILHEMSTWIHSYIYSQDSLEYTDSNVSLHLVFYTICQGLFYLIAFRHKDMTNEKKNLLFLQGLNLNKIISCRLNPLKVCQAAVIQNFAAITRKYQLAYCYTIMEHNARSNLPVYNNTENLVTITLEPFFPFDPYFLPWSAHRISPLYYNSQCMNLDVERPKSNQCEDEDDFMEESLSPDTSSQCYLEKFSYGTSPGFIQT